MNVARANVVCGEGSGAYARQFVNFTGTWNANLSKSRFLGPLPIAITVKIEHSEPELQEEILVTKVDGSEERVVFECWTNGEESLTE
jgi:hypothetical protein